MNWWPIFPVAAKGWRRIPAVPPPSPPPTSTAHLPFPLITHPGGRATSPVVRKLANSTLCLFEYSPSRSIPATITTSFGPREVLSLTACGITKLTLFICPFLAVILRSPLSAARLVRLEQATTSTLHPTCHSFLPKVKLRDQQYFALRHSNDHFPPGKTYNRRHRIPNG